MTDPEPTAGTAVAVAEMPAREPVASDIVPIFVLEITGDERLNLAKTLGLLVGAMSEHLARLDPIARVPYFHRIETLRQLRAVVTGAQQNRLEVRVSIDDQPLILAHLNDCAKCNDRTPCEEGMRIIAQIAETMEVMYAARAAAERDALDAVAIASS